MCNFPREVPGFQSKPVAYRPLFFLPVGRGGASIYGKQFEDELHPELKFTGKISKANVECQCSCFNKEKKVQYTLYGKVMCVCKFIYLKKKLSENT